MNSNAPALQKRIYFALVFHAWGTSMMNVIDVGRSVEFNTKNLLHHPHAAGFFPAYETLEALQADYPNAPFASADVSCESPQRPACCDGVTHVVRPSEFATPKRTQGPPKPR